MLCERDQMSNLDQVAEAHGYKFPAELYFFTGRDGQAQLFFHFVRSSFMNNPFFFSSVQKKVFSFVLKIIKYFPSISFVFSLNDRSVKILVRSFNKIVRSIKIVRSVKTDCFFTTCSKKSFKHIKLPL